MIVMSMKPKMRFNIQAVLDIPCIFLWGLMAGMSLERSELGMFIMSCVIATIWALTLAIETAECE